MKKTLTPEQTAARDARRAKFKALWKQVADMSDEQRLSISHKFGFRKLDGGEFSLCNQMLIALQSPGASVLGGFRQWIAQGRAVSKGQHGIQIWVPIGTGKAQTETTDAGQDGDSRPGFIVGTIFDIAQTAEIATSRADVLTLATAIPQLQAA